MRTTTIDPSYVTYELEDRVLSDLEIVCCRR